MTSFLTLASWRRRSEVLRETLDEYFASGGPGRRVIVHPPGVASNPLPGNVPDRSDLPAERGWWGYSFRDVPERQLGETVLASLPDCRVLWYRDPARHDDFFPAIQTARGTGLDLRELRFRPGHERRLARRHAWQRVPRATWVVERVYHNHSHWLTAHLPKLLLLQQRGELAHVILPADRTPAMDGAMRAVGLDPGAFATFAPEHFLEVDELTVLGTDRFRPDLLQLVPRAAGVRDSPRGTRRLFISRSRASRRRLLNEESLWPLLAAAGFERVHLETLPFAEQAALMREAGVLLAPHGAGLTNMLFVPPSADVIEIADLGFPNPNFYALACALGHRYWLVPAAAHGDRRPIDKDLTVEPAAVAAVLARLEP